MKKRVENAAGLTGETDRRVVADDVGYRAGLLISIFFAV